MPQVNIQENPFRKSIRIFVSYHSADNEIVGAIKRELEDYGLEVFLAHDDVPPSTEWQEMIIEALKNSDIFMPLLNENYKKSEFTDQETGIAISERKFIIPLRMNVDPYGFIRKYQGLNFKVVKYPTKDGRYIIDCSDSCFQIIETMLNNPKYKEILKEILIGEFVNSTSFIAAESKAKKLWKIDNFTEKQIQKIVKAALRNNQIHDSYVARPFLNHLLEEHKSVIDENESNDLLILMKKKEGNYWETYSKYWKQD